MLLAVKFYSSHPNKPELMPNEWPWLIVPAENLSVQERQEWTLMTEEELANHKEQYKAQYDIYEQSELIKQQVDNKIRQALDFGQKLIIEYAAENVLLGITQQQKTREVLLYLQNLLLFLQTGSLYEAIKEIDNLLQNIPSNLYPFVTEQRLQQCKQKILNFLQQL